VAVPGDREPVDVTRRGAGGGPSPPRVRRPVACDAQGATSPRRLARSAPRRRETRRGAPRAAPLHRAACAPPTRTDQCNGGRMARLRSRRGLHGPRPRTRGPAGGLEPHADWRSDGARALPRPRSTGDTWQRGGGVSRRTGAEALGRLALWAADEARQRVRPRRLSKRPWPAPRSPAPLTTPKTREEGDSRGVAAPSSIGGRRLRSGLTDGCPSDPSACCAGLRRRKDAHIGSSQAATNPSCRLSPMPKALSASAGVFSKREAWCTSVAHWGAKRTRSGAPRQGARRPRKCQAGMIKESYHRAQWVERSVCGVHPLHWREWRWSTLLT